MESGVILQHFSSLSLPDAGGETQMIHIQSLGGISKAFSEDF